MLSLTVMWEGPLSLDEVKRLNDAGPSPDWDGPDYGLYQVYGEHILGGPDTLLYIGKAVDETFADRFRQHRCWTRAEGPLRIFVGRILDPARHNDTDKWQTWKADVGLAEHILIHKYSPNYNSSCIAEPPDLSDLGEVVVINKGSRRRVHEKDVAPNDWE